MKHSKDGRRSNFGGESIEKQAFLVTSARLIPRLQFVGNMGIMMTECILVMMN